ncbi:MAG TPA: zf-HC2 domain-containing protein [Vicinamibacteria bacterium]|nr:zf-HC2 domain-containing protein [Vicinamibacteria bacterium]
MLTCRELVEFMDDYWSGALAAETVARFNEHLAACPSCVNYTNTWREAIRVGRAALRVSDEEVPRHVPEALVAAILASRTPSS